METGRWTTKQQKIRNLNSKKKRNQNNEESSRELWDNIKHTNIHIIGVLEGEERDEEIEIIFEEMMTQNLPSLVKELKIQVQEVQRIKKKRKTNKPTPGQIIIKMSNVKDKERILKAVKERQLVTYKSSARTLADFSTGSLQAKGDWHKIFKVMKSRNLHN